MENKPRKGFLENIALVVLGVTLLVALLNLKAVGDAAGFIVSCFTPLIIGGVIAFILNVPMTFLEERLARLGEKSGSRGLVRGRRGISLIATLILFVAVLAFIVNIIVPNLAAAIGNIVRIVDENYMVWIATLEGWGFDMTMIENYLEQLDWDSILQKVRDGALVLLGSAGAAASGLVSLFTNLFFGLIFAVYILLGKKTLALQAKKILYAFLKKEWADEICDVAGLTHRIFSSFLSGQCMEAVILGAMFFVVLFVGGFPYAGPIAVIIGSMSLIPFVGAFIGMGFGILMIASVSVKQAVIFVIVFLVVQQIEGQIIYPKVVGSSVGLPALWTLLAVVVGGNVSGVFGIILFIPLFSVIYALLRRSVYTRLKEKKIEIK